MTEQQNDRQLVEAVQKHCQEAMAVIIKRYTGYVLTVIRGIGLPPLSEGDTEELASDVFFTFWNKAHTLRDPSALKPFLAQIARRLTIDLLRKQKQLVPLEEDILLSSEHSPESIVALREQSEIVVAALDAMEPTRRTCMIYRYYYNEPLAAIAKRMKLPLSTVKSHIYRGRKQVIATLKDWGYTYEERN